MALPSTLTVSWTVEGGTTLRLQQLLAQLGYLPVTFVPAAPAIVTPHAVPLGAASLTPQVGNFMWRFANAPAELQALWQPGADSVVMTGAVMSFQSDHGMRTDGNVSAQLWGAVLQAASTGQNASNPYSYALVTKSSPETLTVWQNGGIAFTSRANTGIPGSPTPNGTWPVYERFRVTTMSGTNPDGSHYSDPGVPWVSYFHGGDALHGFSRGSYGSPQSLGCVELPYDAAAT
ncbi:MAG: L,D-transpeptidase family protein, partial [Acidimicrobiales bacterium]